MFGVVEALEKQSSPMHDVIRRHFRLIKVRTDGRTRSKERGDEGENMLRA